VAEKALEHGAEIINDPSGLTFDAQLARVAASHNAALIINHMRGTPETWAKLPPLKDVIGAIRHDLDAAVHRAVRAGVERTRIAVDPGLGFGKRREQNAEILARLDEFAALELPIAVGPSRKSFLPPTEDSSAPLLQCATAAAVTAAILGGAHIVRVHDVAEMKPVVQVADQILSFAGISDSSASRAVPPRSGGFPTRK
jgi:dihydropteroate synthase